MRKLFPMLAAALMGAMSFGGPMLARRLDPVPLPPMSTPSGGKGKGHGKPARSAKKLARRWAAGMRYPFSSTRQDRPKYRTAMVNGFPHMQRMSRQQIADLYYSSVL